MQVDGIPAFAWFTPWLARGGQPEGPHYAQLQAAGVQTIVNLRTHSEVKNLADCGSKLRPVHFPIRDGHAPTEEEAIAWLNLCVSAARPLFVHCHEGRGRTGTACALVRLAQGWDVERAIAEEVEIYEFKAEQDWRQLNFLRRFADQVARGLRIPRLDDEARP